MSQREIFQAPERTAALILAGGRGARLADLTEHESKPCLDFGGKFKLIDFALSNCVHSGVRRVAVLTQYNSHRLLDHLHSGWGFLSGGPGGFLHILPAQQDREGDRWYRGTADAVLRNLHDIKAYAADHLLVLAGDHVYKMDYRRFLEDHLTTGADLTVACLEVPRAQAGAFGVAQVDDRDRIVAFHEKPADPAPVPGREDLCLVSMGIYLFRPAALFAALRDDAACAASAHDFGRDVIPAMVAGGAVHAHRFAASCIPNLDKPPYWRDVGTVESYWEANLDLISVSPALNLYDEAWPVITHQEQLASAKFVHSEPGRTGEAHESLVAGGCIVSGAHVGRSLLFSRVRVHSHARLSESVLLPEVDVGRGARLHRTVVARGVRIPPGLVVGEDPEADARRFHRTPRGITLISQRMLDRLPD